MRKKGTRRSPSIEFSPHSASLTVHWSFHMAWFTGAKNLFADSVILVRDTDIILYRYITFCCLELIDLLI